MIGEFGKLVDNSDPHCINGEADPTSSQSTRCWQKYADADLVFMYRVKV